MVLIERVHYFSAIYIVEFLSPVDEPTGTALYRSTIQAAATRAGTHSALYQAATREEFLSALWGIEEDCRVNHRGPVLHLETHGSAQGICSKPSELVTWGELKPYLVRLNTLARMNLLVTLAACHGINLAKTLWPMDRSPVWGLLGPDEQVLPTDIRNGFCSFYESMLQHRDLNLAIDALRAGDVSNPETWKVINAEVFFAWMYGHYLEQHCSPKALRTREDSIIHKANRPLASGEEKVIRRRIRAELHDEQKYFDRFKRNFLMIDLFPECETRFPIDLRGTKQLYKRLKTSLVNGFPSVEDRLER